MPCRNHPFIEEGLEHCEICTEAYCGDCLVDFRDHRTCGECKAQIVADLEGGLGVGGEGDLPPWEERTKIGLFAGFWLTTKLAMTQPTEFFSHVDKRAERWDCLFYTAILNLLVAVAGWLYMTILFGVIFTAMAEQDEMFQQMFGGMFGLGAQGLMQIIITPVIAVIVALLYSSLTHVFLLATKTATRPWHQTMRYYCYAQAPAILALLPLPGLAGAVGGIWAIVTTVIMVKRVHGTTTMTAVGAVLWWWVLLMCCLGGLMATVMGAGMAASGQ